jgi:hypothetical protein
MKNDWAEDFQHLSEELKTDCSLIKFWPYITLYCIPWIKKFIKVTVGCGICHANAKIYIQSEVFA